MELRYRREAAVGLFLIVAAVIFAFLLMWLRGKELRHGRMVRVVFADVVGLKEGDPVRTSGVSVGTVQAIRLDRPGRVLVELELDADQAPRADARAVLRALDFFGARYVDYRPGVATEVLAADRAIPGEQELDFNQMAQRLSTRGEEVLGNAATLTGPENARELRATLVRAHQLVEQLGTDSRGATQQGIGALTALRETLQRLDLLVGDPAARQTLANVQDATASLAAVSATLRHTTLVMDTLLSKINDGRGTIGQLVNDTALVAELRRTNRHLDSLVTDFMANPRKYVNVHVF